MSGYDGEGTGVDWGGSEGGSIADAQAPGQSAPGPTGAPGTPPAGGTGTPGIDPAALGLDPGLAGKAVESIEVNWGQLARNTLTGIMAAIGLANPTPAGKVSGASGLLNLSNAPSAFGKSYSYEFSSKAPELLGPGATGARFSGDVFAGNGPSDALGVQSAPVLGFDGRAVNQPRAYTNHPRAGTFTPGPAALSSMWQPAPPAARAVSPAAAPAGGIGLALAGLAGLAVLLIGT